MLDNKMSSMIKGVGAGLLIIVLFLLTIVVAPASSPSEWGTHYNTPSQDNNIQIKEQTWLDRLFSLFSTTTFPIQDVGSQISVKAHLQANKDCTSNGFIDIELYKPGGVYYKTDEKSFTGLLSSVKSGNWYDLESSTYTLNIEGTWTFVAYMRCGTTIISNKDYFQIPVGEKCTNECTEGAYSCADSNELLRCIKSLDTDCTEWRTRSYCKTDYGKICTNGACMGDGTEPTLCLYNLETCTAWSTCSNNQKYCTLTNCNGLKKSCDENITEKPNFKVEFVNPPTLVKVREPIDLQVKVTNDGGNGEMKVEAGIYYDSTLKDWGYTFSLFSIAPIDNCEPTEKGVATKLINLNSGESVTETFSIIIPDVCSILGTKTDKLAFYTGSYINCYNTGLAVGQTDHDIFNQVEVDTSSSLIGCSGTCEDGLENNAETDTDCGGPDCRRCAKGYKCDKVADCVEGLACTNGRCSDGGIPPEEDCAKPFAPSCASKTSALDCLSQKFIPICSESFTKEEFKVSTDSELLSSVCEENRNCNPRKGYIVDCVSQSVAGVTIKQNIFIKLTNILFSSGTKIGVCLATEEGGEGWCSFASKIAFFSITDDKCTDGSIILGGGILILMFLFMMMGGRK